MDHWVDQQLIIYQLASPRGRMCEASALEMKGFGSYHLEPLYTDARTHLISFGKQTRPFERKKERNAQVTRVLTGPHTQVRPRRRNFKVDRQVEEVA